MLHQEGFGSDYVCGLEYACVNFLMRTSSKSLFTLELCGHGHVAFFVWDNLGLMWLVYVVVYLPNCIIVCEGILCCGDFAFCIIPCI